MTHHAYKAELRRQLVAAAAREQARRAPRLVLPRLRTFTAVAVATAAVLAIAFALFAVDQSGRRDQRVTKPRAEHIEPLFGGTLQRGVRYRTRALELPLSIVPGDADWFGRVADQSDALILERRAATEPSGAQGKTRQFLSITLPKLVTDPASGREVPAPADMVRWIERHPDLRVTRRARATVGGRPATVLDTTVAFRTPVRRGTDCERRYVSPFQPADGPIVPCTTLAPGFEVPRGMHQRWIVVSVPGHQLVIEFDGFPLREYRQLLPPALELVGSLRFGR